jgi:hypothetical protein
VDLYTNSFIRLPGVVPNYLSTGTTLTYLYKAFTLQDYLQWIHCNTQSTNENGNHSLCGMGITIENRILHALLFPNDQKALATDENDV